MTPAALPPGGRADPLRVTIVGAGVAGLTAAYTLQERARDRGVPLALSILDADARPGGVIRTERVDGFLIEAGPDCFITDKPWGIDLCRRLGIEGDLISTSPDCRRSFVLRGRRLLPVPEGFYMMAPTRLVPFATTRALSLRGKARAALDLFLPRGPEQPDESLASFVRRRFGAEVLERLAQPLLAGIYNADPESLSLRATLPRFLDLEKRHRSVITGLLRSRAGTAGIKKGVSGARYSLFVTPRRGMGFLVERLLQALPADAVRLGTRVTSLAAAPGPERFAIATERHGTLRAHAVVLALGAPGAAALLRGIDASLSERLAAIPYGGSTTVSLGWRAADVPRAAHGFGFVVPRAENRRLIACSFSSMKFAARAPEGCLLVRAFTSETLVPGRDPDAAIEAMRQELQEILGVTAAPILARAAFHPGALAQYQVGHLDAVAEIESRMGRHPGLALAGNGLRGVGVPDCIHSAETAADRILTQASVLAP